MHRTRRALSLVEVLVCVGLLGLLVVPVGLLIVRNRGTAVASRLALIAAHVAREEVEDTRILANARPGSPVELAHDWRPCPMRPLERLGALAKAAAAVDMPYPEEYRRVYTRLEISSGPDPRIFPAVLEVRWQEQGEDAREAAQRGRLARVPFLVTRSRGSK